MFDTLQTLQLQDTIPAPMDTFMHITTISFDGTPIIFRVNAEGWVFGVVMILFVIFIVGVGRSYNWMGAAFKNITKKQPRSSYYSKTATDDNQSKFFITLFSTGIINLYLYLSLITEVEFKLSTYLLLLLTSLIYLIIKTQLMNFVAYVFFDQEHLKTIKKTYFNTLALVGICISPLLILKLYFYVDIDPKIVDLIAIFISLSGLIYISIITIRLFLHNILDFFHIMLYLCTLEILPLIGMFQLYLLILQEFKL